VSELHLRVIVRENEELTIKVVAEKIRLLRVSHMHQMIKCNKPPGDEWEIRLTDLFGIDKHHKHHEELVNRKIKLPFALNFDVRRSRHRVDSDNILKCFKKEGNPNFLLNGEKASFADSICWFITFFLLLQDKQEVGVRRNRVARRKVSKITQDLIDEEYNKCEKLANTHPFLFVLVTDKRLPKDISRNLRENVIIVHAGNDDLFYGPMIALRKLFALSNVSVTDNRTNTTATMDEGKTD